jgi:peptidoglycan/LPS O-acetylase OafA/YrhL
MFFKEKLNLQIQYLRGISILFVFLFHLNEKFFNALYIGVDIFFIISGYVIASSIFNEINQSNKFNLFNFFLKRIKRIYPALIIFLFLFNFIFFIFLTYGDSDYINIFLSSFLSIFGVSNFFYLLNPALNYFQTDFRWLIHMWSLSAEIQFYFFIALFFFFLRKQKKLFVGLLLILTLCSFILFLNHFNNYFSNFYSFFSRLWEFLIGVMIFLFKKNTIIKIKFLNKFYLIFIVIIFLLANFIFSEIHYRILIPLTIALIIPILFISNNDVHLPLYKLLVFYGNISYSFFLWHLPIISLFKVFNINFFFIFFFSLILTTIISLISYKYIELFFNKNSTYDKIYIIIIKYFSAASIIFGIFFYIYIIEIRDFVYKEIITFHKILVKFNKKILISNRVDNWTIQFDSCQNSYESFSWISGVNCISKNNRKELFYILGNSYGDHIVPLIYNSFNKIDLYKARFENCFFEDADFNCSNNFIDNLKKFKIISHGYQKVFLIIALKNEDYLSYKKLYNFILALDNKTEVIFFYPHPRVDHYNNKNFFEKYKLLKVYNLKILNELSFYKKILIFDLFDEICKVGYCSPTQYNLNFIDPGHLKLETSIKLSKEFYQFINSNLKLISN